MSIWRNKFLKQMIIIITVMFIVLNCLVPPKVYATKSQDSIIENFITSRLKKITTTIGVSTSISGDSEFAVGNIPGNMLKELCILFVSIGDVIISLLQVTLLGDMDFWIGTIISNKNDNLEDKNSWLYADQTDVDALSEGNSTDRGSMLVLASDSGLHGDDFFFTDWKVPNIIYSPENIFSNKIAALDANYINPHTYEPVNDSEESERESESLASSISPTIASWYRAFRNIAIVGLLSVLVYIGIRIVIGTVSEKAKYKERLQDWFMALCLVFFMHFIMAGIMMLADQITNLLDSAINSGIIVAVDDGTIFRTNFTGYIRFASQSNAWTEVLGYGIMYLVIVGITLRFTFIYLKRALYLAFFTMIAPLVALTYPIDKVSDGKAQAFNMWIKEYFINAILQPIHLVLYCALVGAAMTLVVQNPIYGIIAMLFISTAEKWIKKMFKMDKAELTSSSLGDVAMLGSMLGMGQKIIGGVAKAGVAVAGTIATGGIGAVGSALGASKAGGIFKAGMGALKGLGGGTSVASEGGDNSLPSGSVEDVANESQYKDEAKEIADQQEKMKNESEERASKASEASKINPNFNTSANNAQRRGAGDGTVVVNQTQNENFDDMSGSSKEKEEKEEKVKNIDKNKSTKVESDKERYDRHKREIEELTSNDQNKYQKELTDSIDKAIPALIGGLASGFAGFTMAGATGENKWIPTAAMGGANAMASITSSAIEISQARKDIINNNISTLVKSDQVQDKDIIKSAAEIAEKEHWSKDKMNVVAPLAERYKNVNLKDDKAKKELEKQLKNSGVTAENIDKAIKDIIKVQERAKALGNELSKMSNTNVQNWK